MSSTVVVGAPSQIGTSGIYFRYEEGFGNAQGGWRSNFLEPDQTIDDVIKTAKDLLKQRHRGFGEHIMEWILICRTDYKGKDEPLILIYSNGKELR